MDWFMVLQVNLELLAQLLPQIFRRHHPGVQHVNCVGIHNTPNLELVQNAMADNQSRSEIVLHTYKPHTLQTKPRLHGRSNRLTTPHPHQYNPTHHFVAQILFEHISRLQCGIVLDARGCLSYQSFLTLLVRFNFGIDQS